MSLHSAAIATRLLFGILAAFVAFTAAEVFWGLLTPGDFYANGNPLAVITLIGAPLISLPVGMINSERTFRKGILCLTLIFAAYWLFVPDDWWVHPLR